MQQLKFTAGNAKLDADILILSIPSGYTCPGALECLCKADPKTGKITDGPNQKFRCYSAALEGLFSNAREMRWFNLRLLLQCRTMESMRNLIVESLQASLKNCRAVRIHGGGDFFSQNYFDAWMHASMRFPEVIFYAYTKSIPYWVDYLFARLEIMPGNMRLVASHGGKSDHLIARYGLVSSKVVFHPDEAKILDLEVDHDDHLAMAADEDFALLIHGQQKPGSNASVALKLMRDSDIKFGYSKKK